MKFRSQLLIVPLFFLPYLSSCNLHTKNGSIEDLESLVQEVETNQKSYSEEEWSEVEERYLTLCAERIALYENKLNSGEREKINRLIGKYNAIKVKHDLRNIKEDFHDLAGQTRSFINELSKEE